MTDLNRMADSIGTLVRDAGDDRPHPKVPVEAVGSAAVTHSFISIVILTLNEAAYIEACLASLVKQWPAAFCEIIVMDAGSSDGRT